MNLDEQDKEQLSIVTPDNTPKQFEYAPSDAAFNALKDYSEYTVSLFSRHRKTIMTLIPVGSIAVLFLKKNFDKVSFNRKQLVDVIRKTTDSIVERRSKISEIIKDQNKLKCQAYHLKNSVPDKDNYLSKANDIASKIESEFNTINSLMDDLNNQKKLILEGHPLKLIYVFSTYSDLFKCIEAHKADLEKITVFWTLNKALGKAYDHWLQGEYKLCLQHCKYIEKIMESVEPKIQVESHFWHIKETLTELTASSYYFTGDSAKSYTRCTKYLESINFKGLESEAEKFTMNNLSYLLMQHGYFAEAEKLLKYLRYYYPLGDLWLRHYAELCYHTHRIDKACAYITEAIKLNPNNIDFQLLYLEILIHKEKSEPQDLRRFKKFSQSIKVCKVIKKLFSTYKDNIHFMDNSIKKYELLCYQLEYYYFKCNFCLKKSYITELLTALNEYSTNDILCALTKANVLLDSPTFSEIEFDVVYDIIKKILKKQKFFKETIYYTEFSIVLERFKSLDKFKSLNENNEIENFKEITYHKKEFISADGISENGISKFIDNIDKQLRTLQEVQILSKTTDNSIVEREIKLEYEKEYHGGLSRYL